MEEQTPPEAERLEQLWAGRFGDSYVERNLEGYANRGPFWGHLLDGVDVERVLEVGCNVGGNLRWLAARLDPSHVYGVDVNKTALRSLKGIHPDVNACWGYARELPFRDAFFDLVFTMGVLIHQPDDTLPQVMSEMVRCSRRWVLCGEYFAPETSEVPYRGVEGALFRRDYGRLFLDRFPSLSLVDSGFLGKDQGWDDVTWWLFRAT